MTIRLNVRDHCSWWNNALPRNRTSHSWITSRCSTYWVNLGKFTTYYHQSFLTIYWYKKIQRLYARKFNIFTIMLFICKNNWKMLNFWHILWYVKGHWKSIKIQLMNKINKWYIRLQLVDINKIHQNNNKHNVILAINHSQTEAWYIS